MPEGTIPAMTDLEVIHVDVRTVSCDGGGGPLGHPRIYMTITQDRVMCPYCSRIFVLNPGAGHVSGH